MRAEEQAPYMTAEELATRWSMHRDTVYNVSAQELPYMKLGANTRRYRLQDVVHYERARTRGGSLDNQEAVDEEHA